MIIHYIYNADGNRVVTAVNNSKEKITDLGEFQCTADKNITTKEEAFSIINKRSVEDDFRIIAKSRFAKETLIHLCNPAR